MSEESPPTDATTPGPSPGDADTKSAGFADAPADAGSTQPLTFSSFVVSLSTSALILMGEQIDPQQPPQNANLPQAKEIIDILSILQEKTHGNLLAEEETILRDMLYALRMKYVDRASGSQSAPAT